MLRGVTCNKIHISQAVGKKKMMVFVIGQLLGVSEEARIEKKEVKHSSKVVYPQ